ncbi:MAG: FAD-linked oxidase C-terminal domain-containing protein [Xanthomonadales bacterium]|nr:FAD-linked oxidase C-terminal domain-containing protein [Xanthomonadales bacterium]
MRDSTRPRQAAAEIKTILGRRFMVGQAARDHHSRDESWHEPAMPEAVCQVESVSEVSQVVSICHRYRIPVIPFGAGSGCEGGVIATSGGFAIDLAQMNRILEVNNEDADCRVQAGVTRQQLNRYLRDSGLFFPVDPGAEATFGGMAATRASGTNAVRYGTMRENVLSLTAVMADGSVIRTGQRARKSSAGYDLTRLLIGSEGTLGIIVELVLRLCGRPEAIAAAMVSFPDVDTAVHSAIQTIQCGIPVARVELINAAQMHAINRYSKTSYPEQASLIMEFQGSALAVEEQARTVAEICRDAGGSDFRWSANEDERRQLWHARHMAAYASMAMRPNSKALSTDVCVPISRLAECIRQTQADLDRNCDLPTFILGHVGDGNFHCVMLIDPESAAERSQAAGISERLSARAIAMDGTCTGEHGIGIGKREYLEQEFGIEAIAVMRAIKSALDPQHIMNPGKVLLPCAPHG